MKNRLSRYVSSLALLLLLGAFRPGEEATVEGLYINLLSSRHMGTRMPVDLNLSPAR